MTFAIEKHLKEIERLRRESDKLPDDNAGALMIKIEKLANCLVYIGRVSSFLDGEYKRIYARRQLEFHQAFIAATKDKKAHAEIAVAELRKVEAESYEDMMRWRNAFSSTTEELHSLKLKMKINFHLGAG